MHHPMHMQEYTLLFVQSTFSEFVSEGGGRVNKLSVYLKYYCLREGGEGMCVTLVCSVILSTQMWFYLVFQYIFCSGEPITSLLAR